MKNPVKPTIKSFLIADMVIREEGTHKWSAIGIFENIYARKFPCLHNSLSLYIKLSDAEGDYDIKVEFCNDQEQKISVFKGIKLSVPSRLDSPDFGISTKNLPILRPGKYFFNLYFNEEFVSSIPIEVKQL